MSKSFCSLGLMSGTSGDGIDASIIQSDGDNEYQLILDKYFPYSEDIYNNIHNLKDKINNSIVGKFYFVVRRPIIFIYTYYTALISNCAHF